MQQPELTDGSSVPRAASQAPPEQAPERVFARRMRSERLRRGWRQEDLAERLGASLGVHPSTIAKIEREPDSQKGIEPRAIRLNEAYAIARVLDRSIDQMLTVDDTTDPRVELERVNRELADLHGKRQAAVHAAAAAERRITELEVRSKEIQEEIFAQQREFLDVVDDRQRNIQQTIAEVQFRNEAISIRLAGLDQILQFRHRMGDAGIEKVNLEDGPGRREQVAEVVRKVLSAPKSADDIRGRCEVAYNGPEREMILHYEFPGWDIVPAVESFRYAKDRDAIEANLRPPADTKMLYSATICRIALRALAEAFDTTPADLVEWITFNGYVNAKDMSTGNSTKPVLMSVRASRAAIESLVLEELDPVVCVTRHLDAIVSPHPENLEPVSPTVLFELPVQPDLLSISSAQFEHLVRQLLEAIGMKSWVTTLSSDSDVDGVAVVESPGTGGLCVVQAKRYSRVVGLEAVRALAGVVEDRRAAKGVLITTSWFGKASIDFAARNGRIEIIDGLQLKSMLRDHLGIEVKIRLPKTPPHWERGRN